MLTLKNVQHKSCELSFIWRKLGTAVQETAFQIALRSCSKETRGRARIYELQQRESWGSSPRQVDKEPKPNAPLGRRWTLFFFFFTFFYSRHVGLSIAGSSISCSRTCFSGLRMYAMGGLGKTTTALSFRVTHSFWLISFWCHPRMYVTGKGLEEIFTTLRYFFF